MTKNRNSKSIPNKIDFKKEVVSAIKLVKRLEPKRKQKTVVVVHFDLPESTKKIAKKGNAGKTITEMLRHNRICINIIEKHCGTIVKELGDAVLVYFKDFMEACRCALRVIYNIKKYGYGIHTKVTVSVGDIEIIKTRCEPDIYGPPVNLCERMSKFAEKDTIVLEFSHLKETLPPLIEDSIEWLPKNTTISYCKSPKTDNEWKAEVKDFGRRKLCLIGFS